jgi:hypothetical protein
MEEQRKNGSQIGAQTRKIWAKQENQPKISGSQTGKINRQIIERGSELSNSIRHLTNLGGAALST